ncbi:hypothetical protein jhhlp_005313 [Lomentospora prolificans]|uniref:RING-type domain-containing protein n=1 Tax=Lomentospora prolificans TaxID=41688 RepID=A0A2N3N7F1_9PEZI|nr:hypothetical protein jhhlp_005313 [Lomentospora prolificans]
MAASIKTEAAQVYDLLILMDATSSMSTFLYALNNSLPEIIRITALTDCFARIGVIAYRDYCDGQLLLEWSGWCYPSPNAKLPEEEEAEQSGHKKVEEDPARKRATQAQLLEFVSHLRPYGGGDFPEAAKTGLALAHQVMRADATTIMMLYTDAPPHLPHSGGGNREIEIRALKEESYGGHGNKFVDWVGAAHTFLGKNGGKKARIHTILSTSTKSTLVTYSYLSIATGGLCIGIRQEDKKTISEVTIGILLAWMGVGSSGATSTRQVVRHSWTNPQELATITTEKTINDMQLFKEHNKATTRKNTFDMTEEVVDLTGLAQIVPTRKDKMDDFSKRYNADPTYKRFVTTQLRAIIQENVTAMTVNPVFGTLWRTVCNDRKNPVRDELIQLFGSEVERLSAAEDEKQRMKTWLEESYNYAEDIENMLKEVPEEDQFPCVYLDPTQDFTVKDDESEENKPLNKFTRSELLEIGRSCDYKILRRLGKVLTRLSYAEKAEDLPLHIRNATVGEVPRIPLALAREEKDRQFWRVLLHVVLPGTMLARRPSALLAALALRMGLQHLRDVADTELLGYRDEWNTLEIPETWNLGCLGLLLDADDNYLRRVRDGVTEPRAEGGISLLKAEDKALFKTLVDYKMLELNLKTTLTAEIGWSPQKEKAPLGPVVICRKCNFPRSVTVMDSENICGLCSCTTRKCTCAVCQAPDDFDFRVSNQVTAGDCAETKATWVECGMADCRAQYVVYNPQALNVRAKCHFCRHPNNSKFGEAPLVDCTKCQNRMIYPKEYRPKDFDASKWQCPHCDGGLPTVVESNTTSQKLMEENGQDWLLANIDGVLHEPFNGRTLFYAASHCDLAKLPQNLRVLPDSDINLKLRGKPIQNSGKVKDSLRQWVLSRRTEAVQCSLCFSTVAKSNILPACGRKGCDQHICLDCRKTWYGINGPGKILNMAALVCPFCRRIPAPSVVSTFGLTRLGQATEAMRQAGEWIYAWCHECGFAKQYMERVCARGAPPEIQRWTCDQCNDAREEAVRQALADQNLEDLDEETRRAVVSRAKKPKVCPSCGVMTEKTSGCDHISCPCGTHWCYACGAMESEESIYNHINEKHGTLWYGDDDD